MNESRLSSGLIERDWIAVAERLPLYFAQVREDPAIDITAMREARARPRVVLVASGGCTAPVLAAGGASSIHLVDINPAQLVLARLKLRLLAECEPEERLSILGHLPMDPSHRSTALEGHLRALASTPEVLGPVELLATDGPDHSGRYERLFAELRRQISVARPALDSVLAEGDLRTQRDALERSATLLRTLGRGWDYVMDQETLVRVFGPDATRNRRQEFSRHFHEQTRAALGRFPIAENPYLCQVLLGRYPPARPAPWLELPRQRVETAVTASHARMLDALNALDAASIDFVHLSNILDWLSLDEASATLDAAVRALTPGGVVIVRQLNSRLDVRTLTAVRWDDAFSRRLLVADRSFFYREIHFGRKA